MIVGIYPARPVFDAPWGERNVMLLVLLYLNRLRHTLGEDNSGPQTSFTHNIWQGGHRDFKILAISTKNVTLYLQRSSVCRLWASLCNKYLLYLIYYLQSFMKLCKSTTIVINIFVHILWSAVNVMLVPHSINPVYRENCSRLVSAWQSGWSRWTWAGETTPMSKTEVRL